MRERIINIIVILIVLGLGVTGTLYFVNKDESPTNLVNKKVTIT